MNRTPFRGLKPTATNARPAGVGSGQAMFEDRGNAFLVRHFDVGRSTLDVRRSLGPPATPETRAMKGEKDHQSIGRVDGEARWR
jgi:hypothetical protein